MIGFCRDRTKHGLKDLHQLLAETTINTSYDLRDHFFLDDNGWIVYNSGSEHQLICWVPPDQRTQLYGTRNELVMGHSVYELDMGSFFHGSQWTACYSPQSTTQKQVI
jgi:hypothetical protein